MYMWVLLSISLGAILVLECSGNGSADSHFEMCILNIEHIQRAILFCSLTVLTDKKLFALKRKEQIQTAEQIWSVQDYARQYKTIKFLVETIFPVRSSSTLVYSFMHFDQVLQQSLLGVAKMDYKPDDPFPDEEEKREGL